MRRILAVLFACLSTISFAQIAPVSKLLTAGGFLEVCGREATQLSKEQAQELKSSPPSNSNEAFNKALADRTAEEAMCLGYVVGVKKGWREGHEHGVVAAQFPDGWPKDEQKALSALPLKQLQAARAAMKIDVPCIPDYVTVGQMRDILVKFIRENPLLGVAMTSRVMWLAYQQAFPCTLEPKYPFAFSPRLALNLYYTH
jgi:hypothetical protein